MALESLRDVLVENLKDLYYAEKLLVKALPKMAKAATHPELKKGFEEHLEQTENHVNRLEQVFEHLGMAPKSKKCEAMEGLVEEGKEVIDERNDGNADAVDAALIVAAQKVEHYEISGYGSVRTIAQTLGMDDIAELLQDTLDEEGETNKKLTQLAEAAVNNSAANTGVSEDDTAHEMVGAGAGGRSSGTRRNSGNARTRSSARGRGR